MLMLLILTSLVFFKLYYYYYTSQLLELLQTQSCRHQQRTSLEKGLDQPQAPPAPRYHISKALQTEQK